MNGEIAATQRLASASRDNSALQGATIAFNQHPRSAPHVNPQLSAAAAAAVASSMNRNAGARRPTVGSESEHEVPSVKEMVGRLNANQLSAPNISNRGRSPVPTLSPPPEQIAARLAASRSPSRKPEPAIDAARLGAMRSVSRMQSQASTERRELRSPTPIRPLPVRDSPVDKMLLDDDPRFEPEPTGVRISTRPSRAGSLRDQAPSPHPSISSRISSIPPDELKPKLPPRSTGPSQGTSRKALPPATPLRTSTPSMASISGRSHTSSSSTMDETEALSNAIVASSLASARASPVTKVPPPPPRRRRARSRSILHLAHSPKSDLSRTPSPPKGMPMTLRGMPKADDTDAGHRHRLLKKHPHKHHEGDRKRWRQEVTEKERKRYEGVWASNKGLLIPPGRGDPNGAGRWPPPSEMVLNLVVREIWSRSRLPTAVLEQVWDLVDQQQIGLLTKEEFVVGMWLIDQKLKGHKLPVKVPDSVWDSVRYVSGIKLSTVGRMQ
ncbi:uncharacterized protein N7498_000932 [Penicillium cinerascens]|uniref:EH domain-containing protein n=1 Tax=Penicillium cinerascens TaxID=70096 RepID=A0A9W9NFJ3_9EURO|nr:uncharacterized protein N7498_000932 [Penicillium cinerascens]KAJ5218833.1 hypothetical protein N7498_000932 [Penicillium cinerascens]